MGTPCEIQLFAKNRQHAKRTSDMVIFDVLRLEQLYSRYRQESLLSAINAVAAEGGSIEVDAETASLLDYGATCFAQSDGLFDISSGILQRAWRFDQQQIPSEEQIQALLVNIGWHKVHWQAPILSFPEPGMELDFGGIVKEYAVDRAVTLCREAGVESGIINLGGDIKVIGPRPDKRTWQVGISHPRQKGAFLDTLALQNGAVATSGDYERCIVVNGVRYGHIFNPKTGWPVRHLATVTVVADFCVIAGSAATIAMLKEEQGSAWLEELGLPHLWVEVNGRRGGSLLETN